MNEKKTTVLVLWDASGKLQASIYASRPEAFQLTRVEDQIGMLAVRVTSTEAYDPTSDYLLRQVDKNGRIENQLVFGSLPLWAGGKLRARRHLLDSAACLTNLLEKHPPRTWKDRESERCNGIGRPGEDD